MRYLFQISLSVLLLATIARAQSPEQTWDNLSKLRVGERIQVVDQKLKSQQGTFVSVSEEAITFVVAKDVVSVPREDIFRVTGRGRPKRVRNALIGLGVGAAVGVGIGAALAGSKGINPDVGRAQAAFIIAVPGALIGAGVGAVIPTGESAIYRAERRKNQTTP